MNNSYGAGEGRHDSTPEITEPDPEKPPRPSVLQTAAGALTAITVTYLSSFLGVSGTVIGVALVSVLTVLGNYVYSSVMHDATQKIKRVQPRSRRSFSHGEEPSLSAAPQTDSSGSQLDAPDAETAPTDEQQDSTSGRFRLAWSRMVARYGPKRIIGSVALVFVLLAGTVTVIELASGQTLSDIVRNEDGSGTSFFGGTSGDDDADLTEEEDSGELPPPAEEDVVDPDEGVDDQPEPPQQPEAPDEADQAPGEEPQDEGAPAPQEEAPEE